MITCGKWINSFSRVYKFRRREILNPFEQMWCHPHQLTHALQCFGIGIVVRVFGGIVFCRLIEISALATGTVLAAEATLWGGTCCCRGELSAMGAWQGRPAALRRMVPLGHTQNSLKPHRWSHMRDYVHNPAQWSTLWVAHCG